MEIFKQARMRCPLYSLTTSRTLGPSAGLHTFCEEFVCFISSLSWHYNPSPTVCIEQSSLATADIAKLVSLYVISQKHGFQSHREFSLDMLRKNYAELAKAPTKIPDYLTKCAQSRLLILLQSSSGSDSFACALQKIWIIRLQKTGESISYALQIGEQLNLRNFTAELYYLQLARIAPVPLENSTAYADPVNHLSPDQKAVLFQGCWSLQLYWRRTLKEISQKYFECANRRKGGGHGCRRIWKNSCERSLDLVLTTFDPLQELRNFEKDIAKLAKDDGAHVDCALKSIEGIITELEISLADHFFGPLP